MNDNKLYSIINSKGLAGYFIKSQSIIQTTLDKESNSVSYYFNSSRKNEEKIVWKNPETTDEWKKKNLEELKSRMSGWQLDAFLKSYDNKIKEGVSLFKKSLK